MPLLELAHVEADHHVLVAEERLGERPRELRLADAGRAEEQEAPVGPVRVGEPGAGAAHGLRDGLDRLVLADDALVQLLLELQEPVALLLRSAARPGCRCARETISAMSSGVTSGARGAASLRLVQLRRGARRSASLSSSARS